MAAAEHYCHCCSQWSVLADQVHCRWCLDFFYEHGRMPRKGDRQLTTVERMFAELDRED